MSVFGILGGVLNSDIRISLLLILLKLATNPQGTAWQKHVRGLGNILQWRGPQGFQSPRSLQVITLVRLFIVCSAELRLLWRCSDLPRSSSNRFRQSIRLFSQNNNGIGFGTSIPA
jgi:hypothetical protein